MQTDTRVLKPGEVFVALRGEKFDGHEFVSMAFEKGASAAIVDFQYQNPGFPVLQVNDTLEAYQKIGRWWARSLRYSCHWGDWFCGQNHNQGNHRCQFWQHRDEFTKLMPTLITKLAYQKTLLELSAEDDYAVVEMAMRGAGQIAELTQISRPTIGVITNVGNGTYRVAGFNRSDRPSKM